MKPKFDGKKLKQEMKKRNVVGEDLARALRFQGLSKCSRSTVGMWVNGDRTPNGEALLALCKVFEKSLEYFFKQPSEKTVGTGSVVNLAESEGK